jgi:hypothetical protein
MPTPHGTNHGLEFVAMSRVRMVKQERPKLTLFTFQRGDLLADIIESIGRMPVQTLFNQTHESIP